MIIKQNIKQDHKIPEYDSFKKIFWSRESKRMCYRRKSLSVLSIVT